jgi:hypothetical protein
VQATGGHFLFVCKPASCSCASPHPTPPSRNTSPGSRCPSMSYA